MTTIAILWFSGFVLGGETVGKSDRFLLFFARPLWGVGIPNPAIGLFFALFIAVAWPSLLVWWILAPEDFEEED